MNRGEEDSVKSLYPSVHEVIYKPDYIMLNERYQYQYPIIMQYLKNKIQGWGIDRFFIETGVKRVAFYAITEFTELACDDLQNKPSFIELAYICDKNYQKFAMGYKGYQVVGIEKLVKDYHAGIIDQIVVCSIFHINEIFEELLKRGVRLDNLISIINIIFSSS